MKIEYVHFTTLGMSMQPEEADNEGFLKFREGYESLSEPEWSAAERCLNKQVRAIDAWREDNC